MDQRTRKLMTMYGALHPRDDLDRLWNKEEGRGIDSHENSVNASIQQPEDYIEKHEGGLIATTWKDTDNMMPNRMKINRK